MNLNETTNNVFNRRRALRMAGIGAIGAAALGASACGNSSIAQMAATGSMLPPAKDDTSGDTAQQIFTAALIAEDLATTFYYNGLVGAVIQDPNLAGAGGSAAKPASSNSNPANVLYLRAALSEEISHANLMRSLTGGSAAGGDPHQTFYFPSGTFDTLTPFLQMLEALESAFIGAYLSAIQEFSQMAADVKSGAGTQTDNTGKAYTSVQLELFAKVAASILGVEAEHRALGNAISPSSNTTPANALCYESTDSLTSVYNGSTSAVAALTPFLTSSTGPGYSLATALGGAASVQVACSGTPPAS
jgi:hypothetical protein